MKTIKIKDYEVYIKEDGNITCTCKWGSIHPDNYTMGGNICRHIKEAVKKINLDTSKSKQKTDGNLSTE